MKKCIIMRGVPGSGKSTKARELVGDEGIIHSTDDFFVTNGEYRFDPTLLSEYHAKNLEMFKRSISVGFSPVIVDNCNLIVVHFLPYIEFARSHSYEVEIVEVHGVSPEEAAKRNEHNVPLRAIRKMLNVWEPYTS